MKKLSEKIRHIWAFANKMLKEKNFEYVLFGKGTSGYDAACLVGTHSWGAAMKWGASVADAMTYKEKIKLHELMTGILDGVAYSIAEDRKKEKQKKEGEKA